MPKLPAQSDVASAIDGANDQQQLDQSSLVFAKQEVYQGPVPHPDLLQRYDKIVPGAAERLIALAEKEQAHRHSLDLAEQRSNERLITISELESKDNLGSAKKGQFWGIAITVACILFALATALLDKPWQVSVAFLAVPTASLVNALTKSSKNDDKK